MRRIIIQERDAGFFYILLKDADYKQLILVREKALFDGIRSVLQEHKKHVKPTSSPSNNS